MTITGSGSMVDATGEQLPQGDPHLMSYGEVHNLFYCYCSLGNARFDWLINACK
jgi:hypothetical protein